MGEVAEGFDVFVCGGAGGADTVEDFSAEFLYDAGVAGEFVE